MNYGCLRSPRAELDRRRRPRSFAYKRTGRGQRRAQRTFLFDEVLWHPANETKCRRGILVGFSSAGLALVTRSDGSIRRGMEIMPGKKDQNSRWRGSVVVTRVDRLSDSLDLVAAEYPDFVTPTADEKAAGV